MIRATIDTSILAPAIRRANQASYALAPLLEAWRVGSFELVVSEHVLAELRRTLARPYVSRYLTAADQQAALDLFRYDAALVELTVSVQGVATHPEEFMCLTAHQRG